MTFSAQVVKVMIASPSDVAPDKAIVVEAINRWNAVHAQSEQVVVMPISWETHATPRLGDRPQEILNNQIVRGSDALIALLWSRLGTPTGKAESGTAEEINQFVDSGRPALVYFATTPIPTDKLDPDQYKDLKQFRTALQKNGLTWEYSSSHDLIQHLQSHLTETVCEIKRRLGSAPGDREQTRSQHNASGLLIGQFLADTIWDGAGQGSTPIAVDLDGDGRMEKASVQLGQQGPYLTLEKNNEHFRAYIRPLPFGSTHLAAIDVNNDGYPELVWAAADTLGVRVNVWSFDRQAWTSTPRGEHVNPLRHIAELEGQTVACVLPGGTIHLPVGGQGLYLTYHWNGQKFVKQG